MMLTIDDLAKRWGVSIRDAKRIVRDEEVPFVALRSHDMRIRWAFVRFSPQAVAAWEDGRVRVADAPDRPTAETVVFEILR